MTTTCTIGPEAVTGARCGAPAVVTFTGSDGIVYAECAAHAHAAAPKATGHAVGDTVEVHRYGKTYTATVVRVGARGAVYAEFAYANGAKRTVRV